MTKIDTLRDKTYKEACKILKVYGKCAIIRPTGFGKTGILTRFIKDGNYKNIVYLYPADIIRTAVLFAFIMEKTFRKMKKSKG